MGHDRPRRAAARAGAARPPQGDGPLRQPRPVRPSPALVGASPLREERIAGTDLLVVRELTGGIYFGDSGRDGDSAHDTCEYSVAEIERIARAAFEAARRRAEAATQRPGHLGRQGERARDLTALARGRHAASPPSTRTSSSSTCWSTTPRCSSSPARRVRRDRHREPLRRHPQRRVGDAHRVARDAALGQPRRRRALPACSSPSTARRPTSPGRGSPTRWPRSSRRR